MLPRRPQHGLPSRTPGFTPCQRQSCHPDVGLLFPFLGTGWPVAVTEVTLRDCRCWVIKGFLPGRSKGPPTRPHAAQRPGCMRRPGAGCPRSAGSARVSARLTLATAWAAAEARSQDRWPSPVSPRPGSGAITDDSSSSADVHGAEPLHTHAALRAGRSAPSAPRASRRQCPRRVGAGCWRCAERARGGGPSSPGASGEQASLGVFT